MDAVLRVDLQTGLPAILRDVLVDTGRTEALLRSVVDGVVTLYGNGVVLQRKVRRLVMVVVRAGECDRGQEVEAHLVVRLWVLDGRALACGAQLRVVRSRVRQRKRLAALEEPLQDARVEEHAVHPEGRMRRRPDIAHLVQLLPDPRRAKRGVVRAHVKRHQLLLGIVGNGLQRVEGRLRREHAALHRRVRPFDLGHVEEARAAADERAAAEAERRHRLQPALVESTRAVREPLAAFEGRPDRRVRLPPLELQEGVEVRVLVVEADHVASGDQRVSGLVQVVQERAAPGLGVHRPAGRVLDTARMVLQRVDPPELLEANAVRLRLAGAVKTELGHQLFGQRPAAAFAKHRHLCVQLHAALESILW
mmetsp:Transcript_58296/g.126615  ORF Transcript_58296/g.126615 Transcript_58296/m.126615 type:complete len:365 (-) Transcript_58296:687-1781(-)